MKESITEKITNLSKSINLISYVSGGFTIIISHEDEKVLEDLSSQLREDFENSELLPCYSPPDEYATSTAIITKGNTFIILS